MKNKLLLIIILIIICIAAVVYALSPAKHQFSDDQCSLCHTSADMDSEQLIISSSKSCYQCHSKQEQQRSHPSDLYPSMKIPPDMPLVDGKLTCVTCHFVHTDDKNMFALKESLIRRQVRGLLYCNTCHMVDQKGHLVFEPIHVGSTYKVTDSKIRIDDMSMECIECHAIGMSSIEAGLGAGSWSHFTKEFPHPIGIDYSSFSMMNGKDYKPASMLNPDVRLFNGKIGCGTCHNIYSKNKKMLTMENRGSELCLQCHNK
ncbi:MAG: cytochrome c3 family protein [Nitrospira sp.]|nr:cytochrome c3 family protein [bacterium]MBL7050116.1 cytochrome c3 family protein [Nitrospira sp.]